MEDLGPQEVEGNDDEDEDYTEPNLEDDPDVETAGGTTLDDVMTMLRAMDTKIDGLVTTTQTLSN